MRVRPLVQTGASKWSSQGETEGSGRKARPRDKPRPDPFGPFSILHL